MVVNNPNLPKHRTGYFIDSGLELICFGIYNKNKGIINNQISIAPLMEYNNNSYDISIHTHNIDNGVYYIERLVNRKDFFATKQQAEHAFNTRTK